ncbi:endonuclease G, mitochondrial [Galendromus occidentalis]|uniref:Endonuclease n=1 Tax=Galendromus occidentalis TaxID=34638 RepID=A0AAJ6QNZ1_9ACAR|nr:endonuclease G, mitochondrial [Galendromus occidentalis]
MFTSRLRVAASAGLVGLMAGAAATECFRNSPRVEAATLIPLQSTAVEHRPSEIMKHGFPGMDNVRFFSDYVLSYDKRNRTAHWVMERLTAESIRRSDAVKRENCEFREDPSIHPYFRSSNADYKRSGFDRGHLAAAGNHRLSQQHCDETFFLSNMSPQVGKGFNRDSWNRLENHMRQLTRNYKNVYVCTGPLYLPRREADGNSYVHYRVIGNNNVAVPTHFFKVAICETSAGELDMEAYVMPNAVIDDATPLQAFQVPLDTIERSAGLLLFERVENLRSLNGRAPPKMLRPKLA